MNNSVCRTAPASRGVLNNLYGNILKQYILLSYSKIDGVVPLVAHPNPSNSTTYTDTHPLGYGDNMVNLIFGPIENSRSFITRQYPAT